MNTQIPEAFARPGGRSRGSLSGLACGTMAPTQDSAVDPKPYTPNTGRSMGYTYVQGGNETRNMSHRSLLTLNVSPLMYIRQPVFYMGGHLS